MDDRYDIFMGGLARIYAIEHMLVVLLTMQAAAMAGPANLSTENTALMLKDGMKQGLVEPQHPSIPGAMPNELLTLVRARVGELMDRVVEAARNNDRLMGR